MLSAACKESHQTHFARNILDVSDIFGIPVAVLVYVSSAALWMVGPVYYTFECHSGKVEGRKVHARFACGEQVYFLLLPGLNSDRLFFLLIHTSVDRHNDSKH